MQTTMKRIAILLLIIIVLTSIIYVVDKTAKSKHTLIPTITPTIVKPDVSNTTILDRQPLEREPPTLLPANETIKTYYKDWNGLDNELYSIDAPLFAQSGSSQLVPPDLNSSHRRVNFY
jgi:hypothetical protein